MAGINLLCAGQHSPEPNASPHYPGFGLARSVVYKLIIQHTVGFVARKNIAIAQRAAVAEIVMQQKRDFVLWRKRSCINPTNARHVPAIPDIIRLDDNAAVCGVGQKVADKPPVTFAAWY